MALGATLDKEAYNSGDTMTLTVTTEAGERNRDVPVAVSVHIEGLGDVDLSSVVEKPDAPITVVDAARQWNKQSDDGKVAVYTSTA